MLTAITGTIGSGKSAVTAILKELGCSVISCDEVNAELLGEREYLSVLENNFPGVVKDGILDKKALSKRIFNNEEERKKLNSLSHPRIMERVKQIASSMNGDVFVEVPLLAESGTEIYFDRIWVVRAPENIQITRVAERDGISLDEARIIYEIQCKRADLTVPVTVIENNSGIDELRRAVKALLCSKE